MNTKFFRSIAVLLAIYPMTSVSIELNGVGRGIPAQIFSEWGAHYSARYPSTIIKYQAVNAADGGNQIELGTTDFCDTDMPLTKDELDKKGLAQFPYMITAITPVINLPGIFEGQLNLNGKTLSDIFLGKITKWNDDAIVSTNSKLKLPNEKILVAHHKAEGGGTYNLSSYLAKVDPEWASRIRTGATLYWPVGVAVENMYTLGDYIKNTPYSIAYAEIAYAKKKQLAYVRLQNRAGTFISPHAGSIEAAVQNVRWHAANGFNEALTDPAGAGSWPIPAASYILIKKTSDNIERRLALLKFFGWGLRFGDLDTTLLDFLPVPRTLLPMIHNSWNDTPLILQGAEVVSAAQVKTLQASGVPVIDARAETEYLTEHIFNAKSVPYIEKSTKAVNFNPLQDRFDISKIPADKSAAVVFYCNAGPCWKGYKAAVAAVNAGYKKVHWFRGGIPEWRDKGYPTESSFIATSK